MIINCIKIYNCIKYVNIYFIITFIIIVIIFHNFTVFTVFLSNECGFGELKRLQELETLKISPVPNF